ncbi:hypothetical protein NDU88_008409 [Pleurodeles waltl]|uniref:Uncharacterized protein n=1 Tax=Pleurodeles waltl TaxID=8319 RepID=A0AAV7QNJ5_PLEWA|nr:hypothetical protein NDU88_008409 [Pleurodeles waltl]
MRFGASPRHLDVVVRLEYAFLNGASDGDRKEECGKQKLWHLAAAIAPYIFVYQGLVVFCHMMSVGFLDTGYPFTNMQQVKLCNKWYALEKRHFVERRGVKPGAATHRQGALATRVQHLVYYTELVPALPRQKSAEHGLRLLFHAGFSRPKSTQKIVANSETRCPPSSVLGCARLPHQRPGACVGLSAVESCPR